jgi:HlyD family secretion protein
MKPKIIAAVLVVIAVIAAAVLIGRHKEFLYAGTVEATEVDLSARVTTVIDRIGVREGDTVKKGDVLVTLAGEDIRAAADNAGRDYARAQKLLRAGSMTQGDYDRQKYRADDARIRLAWLTIASPINGTVLTRYHEPGEMVMPGIKLLALADLDTVWAYIYIPQPMLAVVKAGMPVEAFIPESNMQKIAGTIVKINDEAEFTPKNVQTRTERTRLVYGVKIEFANVAGLLKPGMTVEVRLPEEPRPR